MVLKKNNRQITLLHVYHHASTFFPCWWSAVNFAPGGDVWFLCALNSSVHVAMCATPSWVGTHGREPLACVVLLFSSYAQQSGMHVSGLLGLPVLNCVK